MGWRALLVFIVAGVVVGGPALAQPSAYKDAVKGAVQGMTLDEIIQWSDGQYARRAAVGRYVRWGGSIILGSALIYAGLDYFYNYLRRETGTPLDQWVEGGEWLTAIMGTGWQALDCPHGFSNPCSFVYYVDRSVSPLVTRRYYPGRPDPELMKQDTMRWLSSLHPGLEWRREVRQYSTWTTEWVGYPPKPSLSEWLQQYPGAADGVKQVVTQYLNDTEPSSPSQPWPGVRLDPVPNPNQWTDSPFTRPDIDTDGDGYPDWIEWYEANRRGVPWPDVINNPTVYPDPQADPDGDGYSTGEEVAVGTNPFDPASRPGSRPTPWVDTDGDGYPDHQEIKEGTDPNDATSYPSSPPEQKPEENPEEPQWPGAPPVPGLKPVEFPERQAERQRLPKFEELLRPWEEQVVQRWRESVEQLKQTAAGKFPFGIVIALSRVSVQRGSAQCSFSVPIGPAHATIAPCDTPIFQTAETFRPVLAGLLWIGFVLVMVRRGLDIPG